MARRQERFHFIFEVIIMSLKGSSDLADINQVQTDDEEQPCPFFKGRNPFNRRRSRSQTLHRPPDMSSRIDDPTKYDKHNRRRSSVAVVAREIVSKCIPLAH